jgi:hypothetical protein
MFGREREGAAVGGEEEKNVEKALVPTRAEREAKVTSAASRNEFSGQGAKADVGVALLSDTSGQSRGCSLAQARGNIWKQSRAIRGRPESGGAERPELSELANEVVGEPSASSSRKLAWWVREVTRGSTTLPIELHFSPKKPAASKSRLAGMRGFSS